MSRKSCAVNRIYYEAANGVAEVPADCITPSTIHLSAAMLVSVNKEPGSPSVVPVISIEEKPSATYHKAFKGLVTGCTIA